MNVPHRRLEWVRRNPSRALKLSKSGGSENPTSALWRAIRAFHQSGIATAHDLLETALAKLGASGPRYHDLLDSYVAAFQKQGNTVAETWRPVRVHLGDGIGLAGRIDRLDKRSDGGMAVWLFALSPSPRNWQARLAMPLIQHDVATTFEKRADQVSVGFRWAVPDEYSAVTYSSAEIEAARVEARALAREIARRAKEAGESEHNN